jgi:hypothetical protein
MYENNFFGFINCLSLCLEKNISRIRTKSYNFSKEIGGYKFLIRNKTDSILKNTSSIIFEKTELPIYNLRYLEKIIKLCKENNKQIFLVRSPLHSKYPKLVNEGVFMELVKKRFSCVDFLDFRKFNLGNSEFGDLSHLNYKGARKFSIWFNNLLEQGLLRKDNKQKFIDEEINNNNILFN